MSNTDLDFIVGGVRLKKLPKEKLVEFCPLLCDCQKQGVDANCFYEKFLHCEQVDQLGLFTKPSKEDIQNRKVYKVKMIDNI